MSDQYNQQGQPAWGQPQQPAQAEQPAWGQPAQPAQTEQPAWGQPQQPAQAEQPAWGQPAQPAQTEQPAWGQPAQPEQQTWGQPQQADPATGWQQQSTPSYGQGAAATTTYGDPSFNNQFGATGFAQAGAPEKLTGGTITAIILAGVGLISLGWLSLASIVAIFLGVRAMKKGPKNKLWGMIAMIVGIVGVVAGIGFLIYDLVVVLPAWMNYINLTS